MSFYSNNCNTKRPQNLRKNGCGPCEKILIEVRKVFDACISRDENINYVLTLTDFTPADPVQPLTFRSATNNGNVTVTSTTVDSTDCRGNFGRVNVAFTLPITVSYVDADGTEGTATGTVSVTKCAVLQIPQSGATTIEYDVQATFLSSIGSFTDATTVSLTACIQTIIKVVADVDVLVPSYGYPCIPPCNDCGPASCSQLFRDPIYPV